MKELQTAAVHVVHADGSSERDVRQLAELFRLHPHDLDRLLGTASASNVTTYRDYLIATIPWPVYDRNDNDVRQDEINIVVGPRSLGLVTKGDWPAVEDFMDGLLGDLPAKRHDGPFDLAAQLLVRLAKRTEHQVREFQINLSPTVGDRDARAFQTALGDLAETIRTIGPVSDPGSAVPLGFKLAAHLIRHAAWQVAVANRSAVRPPERSTLGLPRMARGYAVLSVAVLLAVIIATR